MDKHLSFGYWVRRRRKALDLTQAELAGQVYCALSTIKKIELDQRRPSRQMAERLAECLRLDGQERQAFLAIACAENPFDRLPVSIDPPVSSSAISNLAAYLPLTPFVGYEDELGRISAILKGGMSRLIILTGPGGIGKTRLAIMTASDHLNHFPDGVYFVPLAQLDSASYIPITILEALALNIPVTHDLRAYLLDYLSDKSMLLVLDNFEHLLAGADLMVDILRSAPAVTLLVTSREPLNLRMEQVFEVKGMKIPPVNPSRDVESYSSVRLFIQTAKRISSEFALTDENVASIANICNLVNGMPLAIELAASRVRTRSCTEIEGEIKNGLDILESPMLDVPERHRSIRAAFDFSWRLLSDVEKSVFRKLSIFRGGFHSLAAEEITGANGRILDSLVNKSLIRREAPNRYDMHKLLRRYSEEKLDDSERINRLRDRHLAFYLRLAENLESRPDGVDEEGWNQPFEEELDNFRAALKWAMDSGLQNQGLHLATALGPFWQHNGYLGEGVGWLNKMLQLGNGHDSSRAMALIKSSQLTCSLGDFEQAVLSSKESLSISMELKDMRGIGLSLMNLGIVSYLKGEFERGARLLEKSLVMLREAGDEKHLAYAVIRLADLRMRQNRLAEAAELWQKGLVLSKKFDRKMEIAFSLGGLGDICRLQGKYTQAVDFHKESLKINWDQNHKLDIPYSLEALALDIVPLGFYREAVLLWGAAERIRESVNAPLPPSYQSSYAPVIGNVFTQLGETNFKMILSEGRAASLERIIADSLDLIGRSADYSIVSWQASGKLDPSFRL